MEGVLLQDLSFIALDLETTGVDEQAEIIEIGLVKVCQGNIVEKYEKLIKPSKSIPEEITLLTGINNDMVLTKSTWPEIQSEVLEFIDDNLIVAHNASFDRGFLEKALGFELANFWIDTYDLAKIVAPTLPSYKLLYLTQVLNIKIKKNHRALFDAQACAQIFLSLVNSLSTLSPFLLEKILDIYLEEKEEGLPFLLNEIQKNNIANFSFDEKINTKTKKDGNVEEILKKFTFSQVENFFQPGGLFDLTNDNYQYRPQQINLLKKICQAFLEEKHAILEAGTGTGKSLAYLVPGLFWALENDCSIVISTNTIALQEQLFKKDIPFLEKCFNCSFPVALSKGRSNYLCLRRFELLKSQKQKLNWPEKTFMAQLYIWLENTEMGDKEELNLNSLENQMWSQIASSSETCLNNKCSYYGKCFYIKNRRMGEKSKIIITNHALLLQDIKHKNKILPNYEYVIVDEAHNLENEAIKQFTNIADLQQLKKLCSQFIKGKNSGIVNKLKDLIKKRLNFMENAQEILASTEKIKEEVYSVEYSISKVLTYVYGQTNLVNLGEQRITSQERMANWWQDFIKIIKYLLNCLNSLNSKLSSLIYKLDILEGFEEINKEILFFQTKISEIKEIINIFINDENKELVYWLEISNSFKFKNLTLSIAPINVGGLLKEDLFDTKKSVILTSATLAVNNNLNYAAQTFLLKEQEYCTLISESPFHYQEQSIICIPSDLPDPTKVSEENYTQSIIESIKNIIPAVIGGILILFTSYYMLNKVYYGLKKDFDLINYEILAHGKDGSRINLIETLKNKPNSIVLGTNSFWEGIDIKGVGLTTVIIVKLPFLPPSRPITAAKMELIESNGKNSFYNYSLPQAILKFRQGCGRLIRSSKDWGAIVILDNRIVSKKYGNQFLSSIPAQPIIRGSTVKISRILADWMNNKGNHLI